MIDAKPKLRPLAVTLKGKDLEEFHRVLSMLPPGSSSIGRIARMAIRAGLPSVEQELRETAHKLVDEEGC